jgi:23S rRNA pseudouridine2605 synthase
MVRHPRESGAKSRPGQADKKKTDAKGSDAGDRVAKVLARAGVASRRDVERLIALGKVAVNGRILDTPATLIKKDDIVTVDGQVIGGAEPTRLWRYHKPVGLVTTHKDPDGRPTVFQHLPQGLPRVISVGRLDLNSEGLLLLTNDGELARALELPTTAWVRRYRARALGRTTQEKLDALQNGVEVDGIRYGPMEAKLDKVKEGERGANVWITVTISEGKYREVRKVLESIGLKVNRLIRLSYGPFQLGTLGVGDVEEVGPRVIREQLAEFIAPENLPKGDKVATPPAKAARRPGVDAPSTRPVSDNPIADPRKKPSRVRAGSERPAPSDDRNPRPRRELGVDGRPERTVRKPGWAKPRPDDRPARPHRRPRPENAEEGTERAFRPRAPRREDAAGDRPFKPRDPRREEGGASERPRGSRPAGPRSADSRPAGPRSASPRPGGARSGGPRGPAREAPTEGPRGGARSGPRPGGKSGAAPRPRGPGGPKGPPRGAGGGGRPGPKGPPKGPRGPRS